MCGIVGFLQFDSSPTEALSSTLRALCQSVAHRGPEASGQWIGPHRNIYLGHQRLKIIDTSDLGAQPMVSSLDRSTTTSTLIAPRPPSDGHVR
jgi:asparagine synthase (glutamine-hydrolysing)